MTVSVQSKNKKYYAVLSWTENGHRKTKWVNTNCLKKREANAKAKEILQEWEAKITSNPSTILFSDYLMQWVEAKHKQVADTTYAEYKRMVSKNIAPYFADKRILLRDLTESHIEAFYDDRLAAGLNPNTVLHYQAAIHAALKRAVKKRMVPVNVADLVDLPKKRVFHGDFYTEEEARRLLSASSGTRLQVPVFLAVTLGLRRGEICGLKWNAINFDQQYLTVVGRVTDKGDGTKTQNLQYRDGAKSDAGVRSFPLSDDIVVYLRKLRQHQLEMRVLQGADYNTDWADYVCVDDDGNYISPDYISRYFKTMLAKHNLRPIRFHDLRHTNATLLLSRGVLLQNLQTWLGHERQSTTANYYAHFQTQIKQDMMNVISESLKVAQS